MEMSSPHAAVDSYDFSRIEYHLFVCSSKTASARSDNAHELQCTPFPSFPKSRPSRRIYVPARCSKNQDPAPKILRTFEQQSSARHLSRHPSRGSPVHTHTHHTHQGSNSPTRLHVSPPITHHTHKQVLTTAHILLEKDCHELNLDLRGSEAAPSKVIAIRHEVHAALLPSTRERQMRVGYACRFVFHHHHHHQHQCAQNSRYGHEQSQVRSPSHRS